MKFYLRAFCILLLWGAVAALAQKPAPPRGPAKPAGKAPVAEVKKVAVPPPVQAATPASRLTLFAKQVLEEINLARQAPISYAQYLEEHKKYFKGKELQLPNRTPILTNEGVAVVDEAIAFLRQLKPSEPLEESYGLTSAARVHLLDMQTKNISGHRGSDGSVPPQRVARFGDARGAVGEIIDYGSPTAREVVIGFLIDDGVANRGHRLKLLSPDFAQAGIFASPGDAHGALCIVVLAQDFEENEDSP